MKTSWPEQGGSWLWVFLTTQTTLYPISYRGQDMAQNILEPFATLFRRRDERWLVVPIGGWRSACGAGAPEA